MSTVQAVTLKFQTPSAREDGGDQQWSCKFHLSGAAIASQADAEAAALGLAAPILSIIDSSSYLSGWLHYPPNSNVNDYQATYASDAHPGTVDGYTGDGDPDAWQQAEVVMLFRAPTKPNSKGRMGYLYKYIHGVSASGSGQEAAQIPHATNEGLLGTWNTGVDSANRIPVAPDGTVPSADWQIDGYLRTRQLRRGQAPKP